MALHHRSAAMEVIARLTSEEQSRISAPTVSSLSKAEETADGFFNYAMPQKAQERLETAGIYLSPYSYRVHSHPVCKTLENHMLYNVLPSYIDNKFYFVGIKQFKLDFLKVRNKRLNLVEVINRYVTSLDRSRYSNDLTYRSSAEDLHLNRKMGFGEVPCLNDLIPALLKKAARHIFLHDELHYWSVNDLITFLEVIRPEKILATVVIPPEILGKACESLNSWAYSFEISGGKLMYAPDGNWSEMYVQPLASTYLLKTKTIELQDGSFYSLDILSSKFSHHLICITKGRSIQQEERCFSGFDAIGLGSLGSLSDSIRHCFPIHIDVVTKLYLYLMTLKKPDEESAEAKLRQLVSEPTGREIKFAESFTKLILRCKKEGSLFSVNHRKNFLNFMISLFPSCVGRLFSIFEEKCLADFIYDLKPFKFTVKTVAVKRDFFDELHFLSVTDPNPDYDLIAKLDDDWVFGVDKSADRIAQRYCLNSQFWRISRLRFYSKFECSHAVYSICLDHFAFIDCPGLNFEIVINFIRSVLKARKLDPQLCYVINDDFFDVFSRKLYSRKLRDRLNKVDARVDLCWFLKLNRVNSKFISFNTGKENGLDRTSQSRYNAVISDLTSRKDFNLKRVYWGFDKLAKSKDVRVSINGDSELNDSPTHSLKSEDLVSSNFQNEEVLITEQNGSVKGDCSIREDSGEDKSFEVEGFNIKVHAEPDLAQFASLLSFPDQLKGRKAGFFAVPEVSHYQYNGGFHENRGWPPFMSNILKICGGFGHYNSCLAQLYDDGSDLKMHRDNEKCYNENHKVLTVCLRGSCTFNFCSTGKSKSRGDWVSIEMGPFEWFEMPRSFQAKMLHGVTNCKGERISLTFRRHIVQDNETLQIPNLNKNLAAFERVKALDVKVWNLGKKMLADLLKTKRSCFISDLCACFSCSNFDKFSADLSKVSKALGAEGVAAEDRIILFDQTAKPEIFRDALSRPVKIFVLEGEQRVSDSEDLLILKSMQCGVVRNFSLSKATCQLGFIAFREKISSRGSLRVHIEECRFSGSSEVLLGCPMLACADYQIDDFNAFDVPADGNCFWHSVGHLMNCDGMVVKSGLGEHFRASDCESKALDEQMKEGVWAENESVAYFCIMHKRQLIVITPEYEVCWKFGLDDWPLLGFLCLINGHYQPCAPINGCMIRAVAEALGKRDSDVLNFLCKPETRHIFEELCRGFGLNLLYLEQVFLAFDICAKCDFGDKVETYNQGGSIVALFDISNDHIRCVQKISDKPASIKNDLMRQVRKSEVDILALNGTWINYSPSVQRAELLENCLLAGLTGVLCDKRFNNQKPWLESVSKDQRKERSVLAIMGTFGCGKSHLFKEFMSKSIGKFVTFVSPRRQLADSIKQDLGIMFNSSGRRIRNKGQEGWDVVTFETFLKSLHKLKKGHLVILDEIQLFPPGYLDLCLLCIDSSCTMAVAGDPCQSTYDSKEDRNHLGTMDPDIFELLRNKEYSYNIESRRFKNPIFEKRLPCEFLRGSLHLKIEDYAIWNSMADFIYAKKEKPDVYLVSSFEEKRIVSSHAGSSVKCLTFGESTGLNFNQGVILITYDSIHTDDRRWLTALSRFRMNVSFINLLGMPLSGALHHFAGKPLYHFLTESSGQSVILDMLPGSPSFFSGFKISVGKDEGVKENKVAGDPWLKTMLFLGQGEDMEVEHMEKEMSSEDWFKTHLPISSMENCRARWVGKLALKEAREFRIGMEVSEQFKDDHHDFRGERMTNACERYESIYPRHKGNDSVTFLMAVRKRLRFSSPIVETELLRKAMPFGHFLIKTFLKRVPLRRIHDPSMMEKSVAEFEEKKTSKSAATIENHSGRSCRDWLSDVALIFMKSQHCTKFDNRFRDAKAGQTLACFQHSLLVRFAPYMRYIEKKVMEVLPKNFYIHSGKGLDSLNSWVKENGFTGICTESDYEAFDASQDHYILAFEICLMRYLGLPNDLIMDYEFIKTHLGSKLGNFSIMRFTGEASTFLFNTLANMLFTFLRYDLNGSEAIAFAGDDMCANSRLKISRSYEDFLKRIKLKAKVQYVANPTFCGWCLFEHGIFKRPQLVLERINIAREMNNLDNCIDNYAIEVSYGYNLGELAGAAMNDEEMEAHYNCVRFLVRYRHKMRCDIGKLFT
ncbi:replicase polyprotein [Panax ginseng flexivirus 1]|uniref:replicase polyprotein n=1 Tax=Panax ginseng flexivirus 1 TaxID=2303411 RepID=UPI000E32DA9C|nr:replicase polyprotein [Panax ginseng flexivirus 1]AXN92352.1 replicase polyprotein [Panax ginseng flexivirus 1]